MRQYNTLRASFLTAILATTQIVNHSALGAPLQYAVPDGNSESSSSGAKAKVGYTECQRRSSAADKWTQDSALYQRRHTTGVQRLLRKTPGKLSPLTASKRIRLTVSRRTVNWLSSTYDVQITMHASGDGLRGSAFLIDAKPVSA